MSTRKLRFEMEAIPGWTTEIEKSYEQKGGWGGEMQPCMS